MASRFVRVWGIATLLLTGAAIVRASYAPGCTVALDVVGAITHEIRSVAIQPDGKIVVAGYADLGSGKDILVARLHPDLTLDKSFNGIGYRVDDMNGLDDEAFAVTIQFDQKIVVAGYAQWAASQKNTLFVRYNRDGSPDTSWNPGGESIIDFTGSQVEEVHALAMQPDGKILGAGFLTPSGVKRIFVMRLRKDGNLDATFGAGSGTAQPSIGGTSYSFATGIVVDPDGKIVVSGEAGLASSAFLVMRFRSDGSLDLTFQTSGYALTDISASADSASSITRQTNGTYVVGGTSNGNVAVARYLTNGFLDTSLGGSGIVTRDFGGADTGSAVALDGSGNILVAGQGGLAPNFAFARFLPAGGLNLSIVDDVSGLDDRAFALAVLKSGKILLGGSGMGPLNRRSTLALYKSDGSQDCGSLYLHPTTATVANFTANGSCTNNFDCVNDQSANASTGTPATNDGLGTFVSSSGAPATDQYRLVDSALPAGKVVTEIEIVAQLAWGGGGISPTGELFYQRQGYDASHLTGGSVSIPSTSFLEARKTFSNLNWSSAELDALEIGLDHTGGNDLRMTQIYVRVAYGENAIRPVDVLTAAASGDSVTGQVLLNWLNPSFGPYDRTILRRDVTCPATAVDGTPVTIQVGAPGQPGGFVDNPSLGTTYFYSAFVLDAQGHTSTGVCVSAKGFDRNASKTEWVYDTTISNLTTPGLRLDIPGGTSVTYSVSNDGLIHAIQGGLVATGGGRWPVGFKPFRIGGLVQSRPAVTALPGKTGLLLGSQDGHAYAIDALTGDLLWKSAKLGTNVQAAPAAVSSALGGGLDLVFVGTRDMGVPNRFYALDPVDGSVVWAFDNGGGPSGIGMIGSSAAVDYAAKRVYFASTQGSSLKTTWCLNYLSNPPAMCTGWANYGIATGSGAGGDIEGSPIVFQGSIFVSETSAGDLYAVNPLDGSDTLYTFLGDTGAKGFVFPQYGTTNLLASTNTQTMSVKPLGFNWAFSCIPTPATPTAVPGTDWVFTGASDGKLYQQSATSGPNCGSPLYACVGDCGSTIVGSPTYDVLKTMLYVGTDEGKIYALRAPF